ncbi:MAG: hypothetical protein LBH12_05010, partial [Dysgonamonadaceae bacterium]|nr:hypothetical protein [Dysgonamonadaceae bacterium]
MEPHDLLDMFIDTLSQKIDKKSDLVNFIVDSLNIEKESVYRRLNKKVSFSISEMGILASKLGISIDGMLKYQKKYTSPRAYTLSLPKSIHSIDTLINWIEDDVKILHDISKEPVEFETTFHDLPLEFVIPYNNLLKFSYFKWAYYYLKSNDYRDFSSWQMPPKLISAGNMIIDEYTKWNSIT